MRYFTGAYKVFCQSTGIQLWKKLQGTDVQIGDTEKSTGEVMGIADTFDEALLKGLIASGMRIKRTGGVLVSVADTDKRDSVMLAGEF